MLSEYKESKDNCGRRCRNGWYWRKIIERYEIANIFIQLGGQGTSLAPIASAGAYEESNFGNVQFLSEQEKQVADLTFPNGQKTLKFDDFFSIVKESC